MEVLIALVLCYCNGGGSDGYDIGDDSMWLVKILLLL